jgi:hypothetical protein
MIGAVFLLGFSDMVIDLGKTDFLHPPFMIRVAVSSPNHTYTPLIPLHHSPLVRQRTTHSHKHYSHTHTTHHTSQKKKKKIDSRHVYTVAVILLCVFCKAWSWRRDRFEGPALAVLAGLLISIFPSSTHFSSNTF